MSKYTKKCIIIESKKFFVSSFNIYLTAIHSLSTDYNNSTNIKSFIWR